MEFIWSNDKMKTCFFLPTICKIERKEGGHAIVVCFLHKFAGFRIK